MSEVATAAKPGKAAAFTPAKAEQKLREVKPKSFAPSSLKPLGYGDIEILTITAPADWAFEDVVKPIAWASVAGPIAQNAIKTTIDRIGSLVYVNSAANSFFAILRINRIVRDQMNNPCGVETLCIGPGVDIKTGKPCAIDVKTGLPWVDPVKPEDKAA